MKKQDVIAIINSLASIKIGKVEKELRGKILKNNFQLQKVKKEIDEFIEQSRKSLFADLQEDLEKVAKLREEARENKEKIIQTEKLIKNDYPLVSEQESVLNNAYVAMVQEDAELTFEFFTEEEIISMFEASDISLTLTEFNVLTNLLTNKN